MGLSEELLARGYLPKELPPSFSSSDFAGASSSLKATPPNQWTQPVVLNLARPGDPAISVGDLPFPIPSLSGDWPMNARRVGQHWRRISRRVEYR